MLVCVNFNVGVGDISFFYPSSVFFFFFYKILLFNSCSLSSACITIYLQYNNFYIHTYFSEFICQTILLHYMSNQLAQYNDYLCSGAVAFRDKMHYNGKNIHCIFFAYLNEKKGVIYIPTFCLGMGKLEKSRRNTG